MIRNAIVPLGVVAVLGTMLVPLPTMLLDFLLVGNLVLALVLFASTFYVSEPLRLSALPTILLLATLVRLSLNISTTRLILGTGEAGDAVEAFGSVVVGNNLVVGLVVFLLITLVQFLVIAKGSERVAEVSARFTLDALPGKQMSIDADVRAGLIDFETARKKRSDLQLESRFYGALDGAMKFVKGDAIAGLLITVVNICGGLVVGICFEGLDPAAASRRYTLLTVGDGLLSQIPALLNSVAAGMVITRVGSEEDAPLAGELIRQLGQIRSVKFLVAGVSIILAMVPGMPTLPFILAAFVLAGSALLTNRSKLDVLRSEVDVRFHPRTPPLLELEVGPDVARAFAQEGNADKLLESFRQSVFDETGVILPKPELSVTAAAEGVARIKVRGTTAEALKLGPDDGTGQRIVARLRAIVDSRPDEFIDDIMSRRIIDRFDGEAPELVATVVPGMISMTQLTEILRALRRDGISVRNLDLILQSIAEHASRAPSERVLLEEVRIGLRRIISELCAKDGKQIGVLTLDPEFEVAMSEWESEGREPDPGLIDVALRTLRDLPEGSEPILASRRSRARVVELAAAAGVCRRVIAEEEIVTGLTVLPVGMISCGSGAIERLAA